VRVVTPTFIRKLRSGDVCVGGWLTTASPIVAEAMASCGFDWIAVDMEHGPVAETEVPAMFMAVERHGAAPVVRLPSADPYLARRMLDLGAVGLIVPVVESADAFTAFARHCFYPPVGTRGVGLSRANAWGATFDDYVRDFRPTLIAQIETRKGAAAARDIAALDSVDGLFVGPYDLSADLGAAGDFTTPAYKAALENIKAACAKSGKAAGIHQVEPDAAQLRARRDEAYTFIAYGTDMLAMRHAFKDLPRPK